MYRIGSPNRTWLAAAVWLMVACGAAPLGAQQVDTVSMPGMVMTSGPLGITTARMGSGTSWLPDAARMRAYHWMAGGWALMAHGNLDGEFDHQGGTRGATQLFSSNWFMLMAMHHVGGSLLHLHAMASLEPLTIGDGGYPLLLQSGETWHDQPLHDRQHPHDLFMELAAMYDMPLSQRLALSLYAAPVGEPALGPVAYMHRPSAEDDPTATIAHHWQDATHITYGVITAGVYTHDVKLEGSLFNGREPDDKRYDFDFGRLDSWAARLTWNPAPPWTLSVSYGRLASPEAAEPDVSERRADIAAMHVTHSPSGREWATSVIVGINHRSDGERAEPSVTLESSLQVGHANSAFARYTLVDKSAAELALSVPGTPHFEVHALAVGWLHDLGTWRRTTLAAGGSVTLNLVPAVIATAYGGAAPLGLMLYFRVRPAVFGHGSRDAPGPMTMPGMEMPAVGRSP